jgi:hypothetical protein
MISHKSVHTITIIYRIGAKSPTMVNCPNNDGGTCGARYAIISARLSDRVIASSMIAKSVEANERRSPFAEPKMPLYCEFSFFDI